MKIAELYAAGLVSSPSLYRWIADGKIPYIASHGGKTHNFNAVEVATLAAFEAAASLGDLDLAAGLATAVNQHVRAGILTPVIARRGFLSVSIDVLELVAKVGEAGR